MRQIWDFFRSDSVHFGAPPKCTESDLKQIYLGHFGPKSEIRGAASGGHLRIASFVVDICPSDQSCTQCRGAFGQVSTVIQMPDDHPIGGLFI